MNSGMGTRSKPPEPKLSAAALKAREWLSYGKPTEPSSWAELVQRASTSTPGSDILLPPKCKEEVVEVSQVCTASRDYGEPPIMPKEKDRKVESPRDYNAPAPQPLSTIEAAVPGSDIKKRDRAQSTTVNGSFVSSGNTAERLNLVPRDPSQNSYGEWGDAHAQIVQRPDHDVICVSGWADDVAEAPGVDMSLVKYRAPDTRDIDTFTGDFADRLEYPHTMRNLEDEKAMSDEKMGWRRDNMTATLYMKNKEVAAEERRNEEKQREALAMAQARTNDPEVVEWPSADCVLRPAQNGDYEAIAEIINLEARDQMCPQVLEESPVKAGLIEQIYCYCRRERYPFVVAISAGSSLLDRSRWPKDSEMEYQEYVMFKESQAPRKERILGFAYMTTTRMGFSVTPCHGSRHSGQIKLLVHPDYRGKLVGTALLDRVLMSVDVRHRSLVDHQWRCDDPRGVYEKPALSNRRQYVWVDIVTFCQAGDEKALERQERFVGKYGFEVKYRLGEEVKLDRGYGSRWLDLVCWRNVLRDRADIADELPRLK